MSSRWCLGARAPGCLLALALAACGGAGAGRASTAMSAPAAREARNAAIDSFGRRAWDALASGEPERLLFDDLDLRALLDRTGATRFSARRLTLATRLGPTRDFPSQLGGARYGGICLQGAREEEAGGVLGLQSAGWFFDRALVIGRRPDGRRIASWLEGSFLFTDAGFGALDIERAEAPRWEHSDLEIAPCDLAVRHDLPQASP